MVYIKDLLLNLLFILLFLFVFQIKMGGYTSHRPKERQIVICLFSLLAIILCITFSIRIDDGLIYDLRSIPAILGSLYGGPYVACIIFAFTLLYRSIFGGIGVIAAAIIAVFILVSSILFYRRFKTASSQHRILLFLFLSLCASIVTLLSLEALSHHGLHQWNVMTYFPIQLTSAFISITMAELIRKNSRIHKDMIKIKKLEIANHLTASFCHEIRNPMTASIGFLQLLMQDHTLPIEKREQYLKIAMQELQRAEGILKDYLTFAKPSFNKLEPLQLQQELKQAIEIIRPLANMNSVLIEESLYPLFIFGDSQRLQQCLLNMLKNSIEAMPNGGRLVITLERENATALLKIQDTGVGMSRDAIERLGEPFFSMKGTKGTGLGMMVVFQIVKAMEGQIEVQSKLQEGTTFTLAFPLYPIPLEESSTLSKAISS